MRALLIGILLLAACGKESVCDLQAHPTGSACDPGVNADPHAALCKDAMGNAFICRSGLGYCVICAGANFSDGCTITNSGVTSYCVHDCDHC